MLISRIKRDVKMKRVLNQKVNEHNQQIHHMCMRGEKSLIGNIRDDIMSLQKIQVELEAVRLMGDPTSTDGDMLS